VLTQLLVLWLLSERPLNGYELKRILQDSSTGLWAEIEAASIYSVLRTFERRGVVEAVAADGATRQSTQYRITRDGRRVLRELAERAWRGSLLDLALGQAAIATGGELEPERLRALARERLARIESELQWARSLERSALDAQLAVRMSALLAADADWLRSLVARFPHFQQPQGAPHGRKKRQPRSPADRERGRPQRRRTRRADPL
jgi:DNA-binding PadR family transcriptional regulator